MEPFGMSISFAAILAICEKVAKGLYTIYRNTDLLSQATDSLIREVTILRDIAESLERSLKEHHSPKNRSSNLRSLHFVERARFDAQITLEKIDSTLFEMDSGSSTFSFINQIKAGTHLEEIAAFTQQLAAQRQSLTLTLELETSKYTDVTTQDSSTSQNPSVEKRSNAADIPSGRLDAAAKNGMQDAELKLGLKEYAAAEEILSNMLTSLCETMSPLKHKILEMLSVVYGSQGQWEAAAGVILKVIEEDPRMTLFSDRAFGVMHTIAENHLLQQRLDEAEKWCSRAMDGMRATLGETHVLYYHAVQLHVDILERKGKIEEARTYRYELESRPFYKCIQRQEVESVRALVESESVPSEGLNHGLIIAVNEGNEDILRILLAHGADVNFKPNDGQSALMIAARKGFENVVRLLIRRGAGINAKDNYGETPLMVAAMEGQREVVKVLLEEGTNRNSKNSKGLTAWDLARWRGNIEIANLIKTRQTRGPKIRQLFRDMLELVQQQA